MASSSRRKETSCEARPGFVGDDDRIWDIRIARPVSVARTRRRVSARWVVNFRGGGEDVAILAAGCFVWVFLIAYLGGYHMSLFFLRIFGWKSERRCARCAWGESRYAKTRVWQSWKLFGRPPLAAGEARRI